MAQTVAVRRIDAAANLGRDEAETYFISSVLKNRVLIKQLTIREIKARYESSMLGLFWAFFTPLTSLVIYTVVFVYIFKAHWLHDGHVVDGIFPIIVLCGLTPYNFFSESMTTCARTVASHPNYVKKVVFPLEILPVANMFAAMFFCLVWFLITLVGVVLTLHTVFLTSICLPLVLFPLLFFTAGIAWVTASLGVYVRDVPHAVTILLLVMLYLTGIFYSPEALPPAFQNMMFLNPLAVFVDDARRVLIFGEWPHWGRLGIMFAVSLAMAQLGYLWFIRTKKGFADVI